MTRPLRINGKIVDPATLTFGDYRKRPVVIQAVQIDAPFEVDTLEGTHSAEAGSWLIVGVHGELYPCRGDIFEKTYDKV